MNSSAPSLKSRFLRVPGFKRLALVSVASLTLGAVGMYSGLFYIKNVVATRKDHSDRGKSEGVVFNPVGTTAFHQGVQRMNILVLGIDYNHDSKGIIYTKGARSDTMMVVSLSNEAKFLNVISIPRDTQVLISEKLGYEKINAAYSFGGIKQAMETVSQFLGVPIDHYVIVKVHGAKKVFDALGGIPIAVEKDMDYDDNWGHLHIHLKKGPQVLSGEQAVGYARFRKDEEGDRGRIRRQQQVIRALVDRLKSPSITMKLPALANAVKDTLETDFNIPEMVDLARLYQGFDQKKIRSGQIVGDDAMTDGVSYIVPYAPENEKLVRQLLKDTDHLALRDLRIRVLNGSREPGAGQRLADQLAAEGLLITKVELADKDNYNKTEIIEHTKNPRMHTRLASMLASATFKEVPDKQKEFDVTIIVGNDKIVASVGQSSPSNPHPEPAPLVPVSPRREYRPRDSRPVDEPSRPRPLPEPDRGHDDPALRATPRNAPVPADHAPAPIPETVVPPAPAPEPVAPPAATPVPPQSGANHPG